MAQSVVMLFVLFGFIWSGESRCPKPTLPADPNDKYYQGELFQSKLMFLRSNAQAELCLTKLLHDSCAFLPDPGSITNMQLQYIWLRLAISLHLLLYVSI
jgi:hypothetical protein